MPAAGGAALTALTRYLPLHEMVDYSVRPRTSSSRLLVPHQLTATRIGSCLFQLQPIQAAEQPRQLVEIARNMPAVTFVPAVSGPVHMAGNWPILRRDTQYAPIHYALVESTGVCGIVVIGDAGVGKTTLARLVAQSLPCPVRWVAGTESARSIPLGVFAHLAGSATSRDPIGVLTAARETILADGRSVIGVDDAHLLDQLSATLLHQLAMDGSVRIVATVRCGESVPDAITSLWKDGYLQRLHLTAFNKEECVD